MIDWKWLIPLIFSTGIIRYYFRRRKLRKAYYDVIWKRSSALKPREVMGIRGKPENGFNKYFLVREAIGKALINRIKKGESVIIVGDSLSGKTRLVYETLKQIKPAIAVLIPRPLALKVEELPIPKSYAFWRKKAVFLDDIDKYLENAAFRNILDKISIQYPIIATCKKGLEYDAMRKAFENNFSVIFKEEIDVLKIDEDEKNKVLAATDKTQPKSYDGNIGSLFLDLDIMHAHYLKCTDKARDTLKALKRLYHAGIYEGRGDYSQNHLKKILEEKYKYSFPENSFIHLLQSLQINRFIEFDKTSVQIEEAYLIKVVKENINEYDNLKELFELFRENFNALFIIAYKANSIAEISIERPKFIKLAIDALKLAISQNLIASNSYSYGSVQNNIGINYQTLAEVENKAENCRLSIEAYKKALIIYTIDQFPIDYATVQNNLGNTYRTLAEVDNKAENSRLAIAACIDALAIRTEDQYPAEYAATQNNLANAYMTLGDVENKAENCRLAIETYNNALVIRAKGQYPFDYGVTQNNIANAYLKLAEVENKAENCRKAIAAFREALVVRTQGEYPIKYAGTQNNIGNAYSVLAEIGQKKKYCKLAIESFKKALNIYDKDQYPLSYSLAQNNLGIAYQILSEVENEAENCKIAIEAFQKALIIRTIDQYPIDYSGTQNNLANAYFTLAVVENKAENCHLALVAYNEALKISIEEKLLDDIPMIQKNIKLLRQFAGDCLDSEKGDN